ncbi:peptidoglycan-binding protein [Bacillus subtilis]|nr:peptidoglycan-binding protein [Bacillus subtilis]ULN58975.1 peptidoglycan-binding protein [Bacillus subtilis]
MKSYHLVGQALDFVPVNGKTTLWNGYGSADVKRAVAYAKKLGFEWGGDWSGFVDKPHLQFNYRGYGTDTFGKKVSNVTSKPSASAPKKSSSYPLPDGVIKVTKPLTKGTKVAQVQTALAACYFYPDKGAKNNGIDGYYGPKTANAVKRFQLMNGLVADGIYGPKTKAKLAAKLK